MLNSGKLLLILSFYVLLGTLVLHPGLRIGFLGDFAGDIYVCQDNWFNFAAYYWNFYVPIMAIYYGLYKIFQLNPLPYQVFHFSLLFLNAWLVYLLARGLKLEPWQCWLAGLLALFNSAAFEAYFWLSTIPKALATTFGLTALILLNRFRRSGAVVWGWGYIMLVAVGLTIESTGLILPLTGLLLDAYYRPWRASGKEKSFKLGGLWLHFWTFGIAGCYLLVRHYLGIRPYAENLPWSQKGLTFIRTILSTFFHGLENHLRLEVKGVAWISPILILLFLAILLLAWRQKPRPELKLSIMLLLLWLGACLPHTIGAHYHSRYLYFPGVFAALVWADLAGSCRWRRYGRNGARLLVLLAVLGFFCLDFYVLRQAINSYLEASRIYDAGIQEIRAHVPEMDSGSRLVLVDFPDCIYRPRKIGQGHQEKYRVLVYRNALPWHLFLLYKNSNFQVTLLRLSPPDNDNYDNPDPLGTSATPEQLAELAASQQTFICRYVPGNPKNFVMGQGEPIP